MTKTAEDNTNELADVKTPGEVQAQEDLNSSVSLDFSSKKDAETGGFNPLENDVWYIITCDKAEVRERPSYDDPSTLEKVIWLQFTFDKREDGKPIKDSEGEEQKEGARLWWEWLSTTATGFKVTGSPSKTRACIYALLGKDIEEEFTGVKVEDLLGKSCKVMLEPHKRKDGSPANKALKYVSL